MVSWFLVGAILLFAWQFIVVGSCQLARTKNSNTSRARIN